VNEDKKESEVETLDSNEDKELNKIIKSFIDENPSMSEEEVLELKKVLRELMKANKRKLNKREYIKKFFKSILIYLVSTLSVLGFLFSYIALENKYFSLFLPLALTFILSIYDLIRFIQFVKKPIIFSIKPFIIEITIMCVVGFFINEFIKIFEYSIIFSIYILLTLIMKILINSTVNKVISKKVIIERRDKDV
jgi:hypothetical protein